MEDAGIMGSSLVLDYDKLGYSFIAYVGVFLNTTQTKFVLQRINEIPFVTVASVTTENSIFSVKSELKIQNMLRMSFYD
jgi:Lrp/AsnC family transcriptional regulator for asnA, asnC and gidA